jgi:hypothetical protein
MNIKDRINKLEDEIDAKFYKVYFKNNTIKYLTSCQVMKAWFSSSSDEDTIIEKVETANPKGNSKFSTLCNALVSIDN